jgi:hypothetical protein
MTDKKRSPTQRYAGSGFFSVWLYVMVFGEDEGLWDGGEGRGYSQNRGNSTQAAINTACSSAFCLIAAP